MGVLKGDYIGFSYNGVHSSDLGIVRTSDGSRFNENLLPTMQDKTVQVPGGDGTYYFGSYFTQRQFNISFAFDSLTEEQLATLKTHFGDKKIHDLVFDERPYKTYRAKVTGTATLKYIPFAEGKKNRLYKGEGTIQFTCYEPYAICKKKWLNDYTDTNKEEWAEASGLVSSDQGYDVIGANSINLYNPGDIESHFQLRIDFSDFYEAVTFDEKLQYQKGFYYLQNPNGEYYISEEDYNEEKTYYSRKATIPASKIYINGDSDRQLSWNEITVSHGDAYVKFNSKLNLIEGYNANNIKTGNVYNQYIKEGTFFKIPQQNSTLFFDIANGAPAVSDIEYSYYYI